MNRRFVYIVGAGASAEAHLPTGDVLRQRIIALLTPIHGDIHARFDLDIHAALVDLTHENKDLNGNQPKTPRHIRAYIEAAERIQSGLPLAISIDNFLDSHRDDDCVATVGKLSIAKAILDAERASSLFIQDEHEHSTLNLRELEQTWYIPFFKLVTENCAVGDLPRRFSQLTLLVFNYDRCIEHFLFYALRRHYPLSKQEAAELVTSIEIRHCYGSIGPLPWQDLHKGVAFGGSLVSGKLIDSARAIRTFTEKSMAHAGRPNPIRAALVHADRIVFIGFGFHKLNMQLLSDCIDPAETAQLGR